MSTTQYPGVVDKYPRTDVFIPEAEELANETEDPGTQEWSTAFIKAMNTILSKKGLRVL